MKRATVITLGVAAVSIVAASLVIGFAMRPDDTAGPCVRITGPVMLPEIPESSGLAVSRRDSRLLWSHNDSGNDTILFALDADGTVRARVRVPIRTVDWEDILAAPCPPKDCLYIADIGDNRLRRQRVQIYRVPEPARAIRTLKLPRSSTQRTRMALTMQRLCSLLARTSSSSRGTASELFTDRRSTGVEEASRQTAGASMHDLR